MAGKLWKNLRWQKQKKALRFWAGSQGVEDSNRRPDAEKLKDDYKYAAKYLSRIKLNTLF